ncbi:hypothetical protein LP2241_50008 [Pseudolactococcus piscium]|nr:hypothetical protein LP2241_50008 [Lactococcus piscium]
MLDCVTHTSTQSIRVYFTPFGVGQSFYRLFYFIIGLVLNWETYFKEGEKYGDLRNHAEKH